MNIILRCDDNSMDSYDLFCVAIQKWYYSGREFVPISGNTFDYNGGVVRIVVVTYYEDGLEAFIDRVMTIGRINIYDNWSFEKSAADDTVDITSIASQVYRQVFDNK